MCTLHAIVHLWKSEDVLNEPLLSFYHMGSAIELRLPGMVKGALPTDPSHQPMNEVLSSVR